MKNRARAKRLVYLAISLGLLALVVQRLDFEALRRALSRLQLGWYLAAGASFGLALLPAIWRWHMMLRLTGSAVHVGATARATMIGHFFHLTLFSGIPADLAKSTLYARWYGTALPEVVAAASLDRLVGFGGLVVLVLVALLPGLIRGFFIPGFDIGASFRAIWLLGIGALLVAMAIWVYPRPPKGDSGLARTVRALVDGMRQLLRSPSLAGQGLLCGFLTQLLLNSVMALNLRAVVDQPVAWLSLFWIFPVILLISTVPVTAAGLGVREGAALVLLGFYGVKPADAVAASLLTFSVGLLWALPAGMILWRESGRIQRMGTRVHGSSISVVIPALNEAQFIGETVRRAKRAPEVIEIIVVDGGSADGTRAIAEGLGSRVLSCAPGRGGQLRMGSAAAKGEVILLLHADTWIPPEAGQAVLNCLRDPMVVGGGFWKIFSRPSFLMLGSRWKCAVRLYVGRWIAGDQGFFIRREALEQIGGIPDLPLMEEFALCLQLRRIGRLALADATVVTSARRFAKLGVIRAYARMWQVAIRYWCGTSPQELRRMYDRE